MKDIRPGIFRAYDIRGVVDRDFDAEWVQRLGQALGTYFLEKGHRQAVVGHDCRHSSTEYQVCMVAGLQATGLDVVFLNMVPTPVFYYAAKRLERRAGVMITASHNPPGFNGFKIWEGEATIHTSEIRRVYEIMRSGRFARGAGLCSELDIVPGYLEALSAQTRLERPVKVVVDGGNGSAGLVCAELLRRIGTEVVPLYCKPDGDFPNHHPDPTVAANIADLGRLVRAEKADLGVGLDGDGDRIGVVDENGELLYGDRLLAVFAREVLAKHPGATVIGEVKCSHLLYRDIEAHGGSPLMWKAGHSLIKAKMRDTGALLAGEMSGHMFFADRYHGFDDALYAAQRLVEILGREPHRPLSSFLDDWPTTFTTPEIRLDCPDEIKFSIVDRALEHFRTRYPVIDVDGVRITFAHGWALVRASNTQPALVLRFEADSEQRLADIRAIVEPPLGLWIQEALSILSADR